MSRSEVVSIRFTPDEVAALKAAAKGEDLSAYLRRHGLTHATPATTSWGMRTWNNPEFCVAAAPGRTISVSRTWNLPSGMFLRDPRAARKLAAALLEAADVAEQPDPCELVSLPCTCGHPTSDHKLDWDRPGEGVTPDCDRCECMDFTPTAEETSQ